MSHNPEDERRVLDEINRSEHDRQFGEGDIVARVLQRREEYAQSPEFTDRMLQCVGCEQKFCWTAGEQEFFHDKGLKNEPRRCKPCKQAKNQRMAAVAAARVEPNQKVECAVNCAQCGIQTTVPFFPSQGRPVFCRECFLAQPKENQ